MDDSTGQGSLPLAGSKGTGGRQWQQGQGSASGEVRPGPAVRQEPGLVLRHEKRQVTSLTISRVAVYERDVRVMRVRIGTVRRVGGGTRGPIREFSRRAARELLHRARNVSGLVAMLTLTYPGEWPTDGRRVKRDWAALRRWLTHRGLAGLWWLEFQERGAPHLHVYVTGEVDKQELAEAWYRIVGSGDERHLRAGTRVEGIRKPHAVAAYAAKYARKQEQKQVPPEYQKVGRFWGLFGGLKVEPIAVVDGWQEQGSKVVRAVRVVRQVDQRQRVAVGRKEFRDGGRFSFTSWDTGPLLRGYVTGLEEQEEGGPEKEPSAPAGGALSHTEGCSEPRRKRARSREGPVVPGPEVQERQV